MSHHNTKLRSFSKRIVRNMLIGMVVGLFFGLIIVLEGIVKNGVPGTISIVVGLAAISGGACTHPPLGRKLHRFLIILTGMLLGMLLLIVLSISFPQKYPFSFVGLIGFGGLPFLLGCIGQFIDLNVDIDKVDMSNSWYEKLTKPEEGKGFAEIHVHFAVLAAGLAIISMMWSFDLAVRYPILGKSSKVAILSMYSVLYTYSVYVLFSLVSDSIKYLYGFKPVLRIRLSSFALPQNADRSNLGILIITVVSYFLFIHAFAIIFSILSHLDSRAFNVGRMDLFSATYFSLVTAATVGYGDIQPQSTLARLVVSCEILINFLYAVLIFSVVAALAARGSK